MRQNLGFLPEPALSSNMCYDVWCSKTIFLGKRHVHYLFCRTSPAKFSARRTTFIGYPKRHFFSFKKNCRISLQAIQVRRFDSGVWPTFFSFFSKNMNIVLIILKNGTTMHYGHRYIFVRKKVFLRLAKLPKKSKINFNQEMKEKWPNQFFSST